MIGRLLPWTAAVAALVIVSWWALVLVARRLPPGLLRQLAQFFPACVTLGRRLRKNPAVPRAARLAVLVAIVWVASPIDLIPEFLPVIGPFDDVLVVVLALRYAARRVPRDVIRAAWPGEPRLLERLIGADRRSQNDGGYRVTGQALEGSNDGTPTDTEPDSNS